MVNGTDVMMLLPLLSRISTVKVKVPLTVGVPLIRPVEAPSVNPVGRTSLMDQVYGGNPPVTVRVWLYGISVVPFGSDASKYMET
jgi:hypothetical protein